MEQQPSNYFLELCDGILEELAIYYDNEVQEVPDTGYSKESIKNLVQMVEDKSFKTRELKDIENILTEIGLKISRQISSVPVNISKFTRKIAREYGPECAGLAREYNVYFNKTMLFKYEKSRAIETLYTILHELYHIKQFYEIQNLLHDRPCENNTVFTMFQSILTGSYDPDKFKEIERDLEKIFSVISKKTNKYNKNSDQEQENANGENDTENKNYKQKKEKIDTETKLYLASLCELDANLFAINTINSFIKKGYFKNPEKAKKALTETTAYDMLTYCQETINCSKNVYNHNKKVLSKIEEFEDGKDYIVNGEVVLDKDEIETLKLFYETIKCIDMGKFAQQMKDKVEKIKTEFLLNEAFETYKYDS